MRRFFQPIARTTQELIEKHPPPRRALNPNRSTTNGRESSLTSSRTCPRLPSNPRPTHDRHPRTRREENNEVNRPQRQSRRSLRPVLQTMSPNRFRPRGRDVGQFPQKGHLPIVCGTHDCRTTAGYRYGFSIADGDCTGGRRTGIPIICSEYQDDSSDTSWGGAGEAV
jgi:hypothetical protein